MAEEKAFNLWEADKMTEIEKVKQGLKCHLHQSTKHTVDCDNCPYNYNEAGDEVIEWEECLGSLYEDAVLLIDDMANTIKLLEA